TNGACPVRLRSAPFTLGWTLSAQPPGGRGATFTSNGASASLTPLSPGAYDVKLTATSQDGKIGSVIRRVTAQPCGANPPVPAGFVATQALPGGTPTPLD